MLRKIQQFIKLPNSVKWIFIKMGLIVPVTDLGIKTIGFKRTVNLLKHFVKSPANTKENVDLLIDRYRNVLFLYTRQFPFFGNCLARSLTLWFMLINQGIVTDLRFGMKKENQKLLAHAWIEYQGEPLATEKEINENYSFFQESILTKLVK